MMPRISKAAWLGPLLAIGIGNRVQKYQDLDRGAGREAVEDYANGLQPVSGHKLCTLPCSGPMGEGRQATQADRPRYVEDGAYHYF